MERPIHRWGMGCSVTRSLRGWRGTSVRGGCVGVCYALLSSHIASHITTFTLTTPTRPPGRWCIPRPKHSARPELSLARAHFSTCTLNKASRKSRGTPCVFVVMSYALISGTPTPVRCDDPESDTRPPSRRLSCTNDGRVEIGIGMGGYRWAQCRACWFCCTAKALLRSTRMSHASHPTPTTPMRTAEL